MSLDFGSPSDIKLPNRRSARDTSPRFQHELDAIRSELRAVAMDPGSGNGGGGGGGAAAAAVSNEDELTQLYHELQRCAAKLEHEKAQRRKIEAELENVRTQRLRDTADVVQELERKRVELSTLREERSMMKEWLDRGVSECKRVADEVARLKAELEASEKSCAALAREKQKLTGTIQQLSDELATVQVALEKIHHEKSILELRSEEAGTQLHHAEDERRTAVAEADRLASEVARLGQRVRGLDDAELAMQSMCNCVSQLAAEVHSFDAAVSRGSLDEVLPHQPLAEASSFDVGQSKPLSTMVIEAKRLLQHLQESVSRLNVSVKRFLADKQSQYSDTQRAQRAEMEAIQRDRDVLIQQYQAERDALQRRIQDLEAEIVNVADGVHRDMSVEASERLAALDRLSKANSDLATQNDALRSENDHLRAKAKKMKIDWNKVDESRRRFQQLQVEVQLMREYNEKLTLENRNLKLMMEGNASGFAAGSIASYGSSSTSGISGGSPQTAIASRRQAFEEWKSRHAADHTNVHF